MVSLPLSSLFLPFFFATMPSGTASTSANSMVAPTYGGTFFDSSGKELAWTGGKPSVDFKNTTAVDYATPFAIRGDHSGKTYTTCTTGISPKFSFTSATFSVEDFAPKVLKHLIRCGLDSEFYMINRATNTLCDIVTFYSHFSRTEVASFVNGRKEINHADTYDSYSLTNLNTSFEYLWDCLDGEAQTTLQYKVSSSMISGPELWMLIVDEKQSGSYYTYREFKRELENMKLSDYPGEDIKAVSKRLRTICTALSRANRLPEDVLILIIDLFCQSTVRPFQNSFDTRRTSVETYERKSRNKTTAQLLADGIDIISFDMLIDEAEAKYVNLLQAKLWGPAATAGDKFAAPSAFTAAEFDAHVNNLIQRARQPLTPAGSSNGDTSNITCHGCGKMGHYRTTCPENKNPSWKRTPPSDGAPHNKNCYRSELEMVRSLPPAGIPHT